MLENKDLIQLKEKGIEPAEIEKQLEQFKNGFPFSNLLAPATIGKGIIQLNEDDINKYKELHKKLLSTKKTVKFVPASGAATRMFQKIFDVIQQNENNYQKYLQTTADKSFNSATYAFENIRSFAFFDDLKELCKKENKDIEELIKKNDYLQIFNLMLFSNGLNYSNLPKGLIKFHKYPEEIRTAAEEHLVEGAKYANCNGMVNIHFTVSTEHLSGFEKLIEKVKPKYEERFGVKYSIEYSTQDKSTDTIAATSDNKPFRDESGQLVFRPAGHGALLKNLNELNSDVVFIKNIDNVVTESIISDTVQYKEILGGILFELSEEITSYLQQLENPENVDLSLISKMLWFTDEKLFNRCPQKLLTTSKETVLDWLRKTMNRPLRVCGMVKNESEPGGGPFWVQNSIDTKSLQIVETAQIDPNNNEQIEILKSSTHFNPVDLVCWISDYKGQKFDLPKYRDDNTGMISIKSKSGNELKALELPGLWNGSMAHWNTIFVEVPLSTFNPVKTVNDLLRKEHL